MGERDSEERDPMTVAISNPARMKFIFSQRIK